MSSLKLAVLGSPIAHSRTPQLQGCFASGAGVKDFSCDRIETTGATLPDTVARLIREGYDGFNCTMPLKTDMAALADEITEEARILRSVNTVAVRGERLIADTTDGGGILLTIRRALGGAVEFKNLRVLLLGAGGAARSAALSVSLAGAKVTILNRTLDAALSLADMIGGIAAAKGSAPAKDAGVDCLTLTADNLSHAAATTDVLINCTALGMTGVPDDFESFDFLSRLPRHALVIDAVYNPLETSLLRAAAANGLPVMSGLWMLVYQGALAFAHWTGRMPDEASCARAFDTISRL